MLLTEAIQRLSNKAGESDSDSAMFKLALDVLTDKFTPELTELNSLRIEANSLREANPKLLDEINSLKSEIASKDQIIGEISETPIISIGQ